MKTTWIKRALFAVAGLFAVALGWWAAFGKPTIAFQGFRDVGGERLAVVTVRNGTGRRFSHYGALSAQRCDAQGRPVSSAEVAAFSFHGSRGILEPGGRAEFLVRAPLVLEGFDWMAKPFRVGFRYAPAPLANPDRIPRWLRPFVPKVMTRSRQMIIWSEVVTP